MPNLNIYKILTFITALAFSIFSTNCSTKAYTNEALPENKSQFN